MNALDALCAQLTRDLVAIIIIIIIIIIKKVKIIVTLSIKNTSGALYKSQIKGENRYCLWPRNSNVFRR